ncbi:NRDE family protein [Pontimicrobium aquaticum]|uniref:NRDE family protein n=1 Tax=Pontimicrobium aquaticum TaxID=2565367 RepID=A0A4U0F1I5_9FLAO|nr:NRDE family protein [Pontimicrobium aquaticum]TJY36472.1 NRDE family protein [Pontimicrobium aquaticum]
MCTVTLIPKGLNDFVLTSNRDEAPNRTTLPPKFYQVNKIKLLYPKDEVAGGSWIGLSNKQRVLCVLNGGFKAHERKASYRLSRGIVLKDLLVADNLNKAIEDYNLEDIEPFTLVIVEWNSKMEFKELVWDGTTKHFSNLPLEPKIWSSSSLYNAEMKQERLQWFDDFKEKDDFSLNSIMKFHKTAGNENEDFGVIMDRFFVKTTSITQIIKTNNDINMSFENLQTKSFSEQLFKF